VVWVELDSTTDLAELAGEVVRRISGGEVVLIPTETQYGLCCDAENRDSVAFLNRIKARDAVQPSAVYVRDWEHASVLVESVPDGIGRFVSHFWPGALTVVAQSSGTEWPGIVTAQGTIGLRCSAHPLVHRIVALSPVYLTATSANRHGEPPSADKESLSKWLSDEVELLIFDSGVRDDAQASTVVDITGDRLSFPRIGEIEASVVLAVWDKEIRRE